jgi:hypothetical protein
VAIVRQVEVHKGLQLTEAFIKIGDYSESHAKSIMVVAVGSRLLAD